MLLSNVMCRGTLLTFCSHRTHTNAVRALKGRLWKYKRKKKKKARARVKKKTLKILLRRSRRHEHNKSINSWQSAFTRPSLFWPNPRSVSRKFRKFVKNNRHSCLERFVSLCVPEKLSSIVLSRNNIFTRADKFFFSTFVRANSKPESLFY